MTENEGKGLNNAFCRFTGALLKNVKRALSAFPVICLLNWVAKRECFFGLLDPESDKQQQ